MRLLRGSAGKQPRRARAAEGSSGQQSVRGGAGQGGQVGGPSGSEGGESGGTSALTASRSSRSSFSRFLEGGKGRQPALKTLQIGDISRKMHMRGKAGHSGGSLHCLFPPLLLPLAEPCKELPVCNGRAGLQTASGGTGREGRDVFDPTSRKPFRFRESSGPTKGKDIRGLGWKDVMPKV